MLFPKRTEAASSEKINTAALPDIIFILLFFFMVAAKMRETDFHVKQQIPRASEREELPNNNSVAYIYIGAPVDPENGSYPRLQLNDQLASPYDIRDFLGYSRPRNFTVALKCDREVDLGLLTEVKTELRKAGALRISYITMPDIANP